MMMCLIPIEDFVVRLVILLILEGELSQLKRVGLLN